MFYTGLYLENHFGFRLTFVIAILFIKLLSAQSAKIQNNQGSLQLEELGLDQGLSQSTITAIVQDKLGFIWFGTQDGLNRYDGYSMVVYKHNPLNSNSVADDNITCLLGDKEGNIWIGTQQGGLDRYSITENKFHHFKHKENDSSSLSENYVTSLFEDNHGGIWVGTSGKGLNLLNSINKTFQHFLFNQVTGSYSSGNTIWDICGDSLGFIWIASEKGLYRIDLNSLYTVSTKMNIIHYQNIPTDLQSLSGGAIHSVYCDRNGTLWVGTWGTGLNQFKRETNNFRRYQYKSKNPFSLSGNLVSSIYEDSRGKLWVGTHDGGLNLYDSSTNKFYKYINESITKLFKDHSGILWIGTFASGIRILDKQKTKFNYNYNTANNLINLKGNLIFAISEDKSGELWVGTWGNGIYRIDQKTEKIIHYSYNPKNPNSLGSNRIYAICESRINEDGNIWIGTLTGGLNRFNKKTNKFYRYKHDPNNPNSIMSNNISALYYDDQSDILWLGYSSGGVSSYSIEKNKMKHFYPDRKNPNSISGSNVLVIYKGKKSGLWIGTLGQGLNKFIAESNSFFHYRVSSDINISSQYGTTVNCNSIASIYEDNNGIVWIGTNGGGLNRYDPENDSFKYYTVKNGLPNDIIYGILPDKFGNLWLSTNKGLSKFDLKSGNFRNYDAKDGLQSNEFNSGAYFKDHNGELFFGGVNGFNAFLPDKIKSNVSIPPVYLTTFKVFNDALNLPDPIPNHSKIVLSSSQNFFSFEFVALNYNSPEKNQYSYKLEGIDNNWHKVPSSQRYASYTNLDPGEYVIRIKASNNDGIWNQKGTSIRLIITPPFWMTWWFRLIAVASASTLIILIIRYFIQKKIKEKTKKIEQKTAVERERLRIARDMHDDLGAKITQISILSELAKQDIQKEKSTQYHIEEISSIGKRVVDALDEIVWSVNPKNDTLESLIDYILLHVEQFLSQAGILYRLDIPTNIPDVPILFDVRHNIFMMIQEALNNVVKHANATEVHIRMTILDFIFFVSLCDNGKGFVFDLDNFSKSPVLSGGNVVPPFSNGLENMKKRIEEIGGTFRLLSTLGTGTEIIAEVNLNLK